MLSLIINNVNNAYSYLSNKYTEKKYDKRDQFFAELNKLEECVDENNSNEQCNEVNSNLLLENEHFIKKNGIITALDTTHGEIDKKLLFPITAAAHLFGIQISSVVTYLSYKASEDAPEKIIKLIEIVEGSGAWGNTVKTQEEINELVTDLQFDKQTIFSVHYRSIGVIVKSRNKGEIAYDYNDKTYTFDLERVEAQFIPYVGDFLYLQCKVQTDVDFTDFVGEIHNVISFNPVRSQNVIGEITTINEKFGLIKYEYIFYFNEIHNNYKPEIGDQVSADVIESDQGDYKWRCLKIILVEKDVKVKATPIHGFTTKLLENKEDIIITDSLSFSFDEKNEKKTGKLFVTNNGNKQQNIIKSLFKSKRNQSQLKLKSPKFNDQITIQPGQTIQYVILAESLFYGNYEEIFVIKFENFEIGSLIRVELIDVNYVAPTIGTGPIHRNTAYSNKIWSQNYNAVPGHRNNSRTAFVRVRLPQMEVPKHLKSIVLESYTKKEINDAIDILPCFRIGFNPNTYVEYFNYLIYLEEIEMFHNFRKYDLAKTYFLREKEYLSLQMMNVSESRPSIAIGDSVNATKFLAENSKWYRGEIHKVCKDKILLKFDQNFHQQYNGEDYKVEFQFSRNSLKKQHYAVREAFSSLGCNYLFPTKITTRQPQLDVCLNNLCLEMNHNKEQLKWFNNDLNIIQKKAIMNILRGEARPMPYIIFGPPGTGKTLTLIEIILQICLNCTNSRVLVGTPSNSSANLITERIANSNVLKPGEFVRLVSHNSIEKEMIPEHLLPYCITCNIAEERTVIDNMITTKSGLKLNCGKSFIGKHRITIGTCSSLGNLIHLGYKKNHFTHIIIDEAGQLVEPEVMIPISFISENCGQVILAGDPQQLGPIVLSSIAKQRGYETSFLCRLLERVPYLKDIERFDRSTGYDNRLVTKLIYNYRSVPSILTIYNNLFYNGDLNAQIKNENVENIETVLLNKLDTVLPNPNLRNKKCGVFFYGICGQNQQITESPSWFNAAEAKSVFLFVLQLLKNDMTIDQIGIITPYQLQVKKIRKLFEDAEIKTPKIGSVEEFQGQERDIIIISTVRSVKQLLIDDGKNQLGFVNDSKRLNVSISRAKYLLVIFGNPILLSNDINWKYIIKYTLDNNTYTGCPFDYENL